MKKAGDINMRRQFLDEQSYHWIGRFLPFWLLTLLVTPFFHQARLYYALEDIGDLLLLFWLIAWGQKHSVSLFLSCILALVVTAIFLFAFIFYGSWLGLKL
ncbi:hypothetical protein LJ046_01890 [Lactobacillus delbrueckii subsp. jakobsenii ZN7a-9 = DSM 26046]|uniref:hypothetical protein n=1 Tax=Lactobacillus delbrueckii TaxID=1584 RepID=UPI00033057B2|nr:hypothetical protein [Lactobacillus delbrueckii]APG72528.1 hypothetical protein LJ046_01890 [Lactobacillus delbrueckii subsp. jakobsenii ZN7a-9 = DSM 26046]EOD02967.1 hypothetical protein B506_03433 [Lactobacillus delbrueckii subsp. jakobsenii ZN7a-9 = DSM 26046]TDG61761.1 hypothetical protein C5L19_000755 [Lactobacillus delbrueckii subsp. jakobsenii]